ncbi:15869_t:CDS:1, partial [Racocetra fulgida]
HYIVIEDSDNSQLYIDMNQVHIDDYDIFSSYINSYKDLYNNECDNLDSYKLLQETVESNKSSTL